MNYYATLDEVKASLEISTLDASKDDRIMLALEAASREVEGPGMANRVFWIGNAESREFDGVLGDVLLIDDCLSVSAVEVDSEGDGTFDGEVWTVGVDYRLGPAQGYPKSRLERMPGSAYSFAPGRRRYRITGVWGYGDGERADPWSRAGCIGTIPVYTTGVNGVQRVVVDKAVAGTFTLSLGDETTQDIAWDADAEDVEAALAALVYVDGDVSVSAWPGGGYVVSFDGALRDHDVPVLVADASGLEAATPEEGEEADTPVVTVSDAADTMETLVLSLANKVQAGHTVRIGSEQMFVESVNTTVGANPVHTAVVRRGVNGTTPAAADGVLVYVAMYPAEIRRSARYLAVEGINTEGLAGITFEGLDGFQRRYAEIKPEVKRRIVGRHRKV